MTSIASDSVSIQTSAHSVPSLPSWFGEVTLLACHLQRQGGLAAIAEQVRFARRRFGRYELIDFVAILLGYATSGERTLEAFYERLQPWASAFMALFGRDRLPARSTLSRFLAALDQAAVEVLRTLFLHDLLARSLVPEEPPGGLWNRQGNHVLVFDVDGTREAARQRALPQTPDRPVPVRRLRPLCAPGYLGRKRGEVVRTRTTVLQAHTHQWLGTFGNPGNGQYREELRRAVAVIQGYLKAHALPEARALLRLDGQYPRDAQRDFIEKALFSGGHHQPFREDRLLICNGIEIPLDRRKHKCREVWPGAISLNICISLRIPWAIWHRSGPRRSGGSRVCDARQGLPTARPARGPGPLAPACRSALQPPGKPAHAHPLRLPCPAGGARGAALPGRGSDPSCGQDEEPSRRRTRRPRLRTVPDQLAAGAFTAADVVALYLHRGAFENALADEDLEQDPDHWCSHAPCGQEAGQILAQWVWNTRLELGHHLEPTALRTTEFAPALSPGPEEAARSSPSPGYVPPEMALSWKRDRFAGRAFALQADGTLRCPAGKSLDATEQRREADGTLRVLYAAKIRDGRPCPLREQCQWHGRKTTKPRRVSLLWHPRDLGSAPVLWKDWSRRQHRRAAIQLCRHQRIDVQMGQASQVNADPQPSPLSRAQRAHYRLSWEERLARNAHPPTASQVTIRLFGCRQPSPPGSA